MAAKNMYGSQCRIKANKAVVFELCIKTPEQKPGQARKVC